MAASNPEPTSKWTRRLHTREDHWYRWWSFALFVFVAPAELLFFDGFPEGPDAGPWGEARRPLLIIGGCVVVLVVAGAVQAKWGKRESWKTSSVNSRRLGLYPAWFRPVAFGLGTVGAALYLYAASWSLLEGGSLHVLERRVGMMLLFGCVFLYQMMSWLSVRGMSRGQGDS